MTIDTTKLRELAQNAAPGPWGYELDHGSCLRIYSDADSGIVDGCGCCGSPNCDEVNATFIAAANPATVLALLDALDDAHRNMDDFGLLADKKTSECRSLINWVNDIAEDLSIPEDSVDGMSMGDAIFRLKQIEAAARNLVKVKDRHHSELALAMNQLLEALK